MPSLRQPLPSLSLLLLALSLAVGGARAFHSPTSRLAEKSASIFSESVHRRRHRRADRPLSMTTYSCPNETTKQIYGIQNSGWKSPQWNWGYPRGTGHDCAAICRRKWDDPADRRKLVKSLLDPVEFKASHPESEVPFEEVKLILGLAWQKGRWDGSDGGPGGYEQVLETMADARRYENDDEVISALNFIEDVSSKYDTISRNAEELKRMKEIANGLRGKHQHTEKEEVFMARRTCAGLVLDAMGFVQNGL